MWPLDLSIVSLAGLVMYLVLARLSFDDPRWQYNGWTYAIAVPLSALALAFFVRGVLPRYVEKSLQLGLLFSVLVHLLMLMLAVNVIIFSKYFPDAFTGVKPERSPVRRTVPEYLFKTTQEQTAQPDWSKPTEAETSSPVVPREQRQLPPVQFTAPTLEIPKPKEPIERPIQEHLVQRDKPAESLPKPSDAPAKLARRQTRSSDASAPSDTSPVAPPVPVDTTVQPRATERQIAKSTRPSESDPAPREMPTVAAPVMEATPMPSIAGARQQSESMPTVGDSGLQRRRAARSSPSRLKPAGSAPVPETVAVARQVPSAERMLAPIESSIPRRGDAVGAQLTLGDAPAPSFSSDAIRRQSGAENRLNDLAAAAGLPEVTAGDSPRVRGRQQRPTSGLGMSAAGLPDPAAIVVSPTMSGGTGRSPSEVADRLDSAALSRDRTSEPVGARPMSADSLTGPELDIFAQEGPLGLADLPNRTTGVVPSDDRPKIASFDLTRGSRPRRELGGPVTPFGSKVAAVESFSRRVMRTKGGATPTPAGLVGPATEEAIERGLAFLSDVQNEDGSWSLQGLGSEVVLQSDTAATGLCLLAFQGAGYTHRQHQYADTVSRGLQFLIDNQRTNGDLYRSENELSDRNVAFYSHGISALALSEAYGMTQDPELEPAAQAALDYITATQHRTRGGWRYTPQVSSDTSVSGWMMMALKSGQLSGLQVQQSTYRGIEHWLDLAQSPDRDDRYRYNPYAPDTPRQRHGRFPTPTMTAVGMLMRMYGGWQRDTPAMQSAADYLLEYPPQMGTPASPQRDAYYWYYATQVMFHMGGDHWKKWNQSLNPVLLESQISDGPYAGSWDPVTPVPDRWSVHAGRLYVTTMNLLNLEVYYRHLPIYEETAE